MFCTLVPKNKFFYIILSVPQTLNSLNKKLYKSIIIFFSILGTTPNGKILVEHNSNTPLEIACVLNPNHELLQKVLSDNADEGNKSILLSQRIRFYKNEECVPKQYVSIINSTAAQLRVPNPPTGSDVYTCMVCVDKNNKCAQVSKSSVKNALQKSIINTVGSHSSNSHDDCIGVCFNNVIVGCKLTASYCKCFHWVTVINKLN